MELNKDLTTLETLNCRGAAYIKCAKLRTWLDASFDPVAGEMKLLQNQIVDHAHQKKSSWTT